MGGGRTRQSVTPPPSVGLLEGEHPVLRGRDGCRWADEDGPSIMGLTCPLPTTCAPMSCVAFCSLGSTLPGKGTRDVGEGRLLVCVQIPARGFAHLV